MSKKSPLISIGMPIYNEARWLPQALDALCSQTFTDWELVISDNASTDQTQEILQAYSAKEVRIVCHRHPSNIGTIENFEFVLAQAQGDYFVWASGHDLWSDNFLEVLLADMQTNPGLVLGVPQGILIDEENRPLTVYDETIDTRPEHSAAGRIFAMHRQLKRCNAIYGLHRRDVLRKALPWPKVMGGDAVILVRIAALGDVLTNPAAQWFRRRNRQQSSLETARHRVRVLKLSNLAAMFPLFATRVVIMQEFLKANGSFEEKKRLLVYGLKRLFLMRNQRRLYLREFSFAGERFARSWSKSE